MADPNSEARMEGLASPVRSSAGKPPIEQRTLSNFAMVKGDGEDSYSKNSAPQGSWIEQTIIPCLYEALDHVSLRSHDGPIRIADLGCSSGPNTIRNVDLIVEKLREQFSEQRPEFQAFFNDLPANDFNNLFKLLSGQVNGNFFVAGAPGSFYDRLFPRSTIHVFLSTVAINYLSKTPDALIEADSPASNKGHWRLAPQSSVATGLAFQKQASTDLKNFLQARAAELAPGGLLCFTGFGRTSSNPNKQAPEDDPRDAVQATYMPCLDDAWNALTSEGIITEEQSNVVNWPSYSRNLEEVMEDVDSYGSEFQVLSAKMLTPKIGIHGMDRVKGPVAVTKAAVKPFFAIHLSAEINEMLWHRFEQIVSQRVVNLTPGNFVEAVIRLYFVALIRKG